MNIQRTCETLAIYIRVPEVEDGLNELTEMVKEEQYDTDGFKKKLSETMVRQLYKDCSCMVENKKKK